jgi:hypothetical protein
MSEISVVPINMIDHQVLTRLALCLEERFLATCIVRASLPIPKTALNSVRKQLFFGSLATKLAAAHESREGVVLGITEFDLYKTSHHFIFGACGPNSTASRPTRTSSSSACSRNPYTRSATRWASSTATTPVARCTIRTPSSTRTTNSQTFAKPAKSAAALLKNSGDFV